MSDPTLRRSIEDTIEALVALLDAFDPDPDLESNADTEPLLGWPNAGQRITDLMASDDDREQDDCDLEDGVDNEPNGDEGDFSHGFDGSY